MIVDVNMYAIFANKWKYSKYKNKLNKHRIWLDYIDIRRFQNIYGIPRLQNWKCINIIDKYPIFLSSKASVADTISNFYL